METGRGEVERLDEAYRTPPSEKEKDHKRKKE